MSAGSPTHSSSSPPLFLLLIVVFSVVFQSFPPAEPHAKHPGVVFFLGRAILVPADDPQSPRRLYLAVS